MLAHAGPCWPMLPHVGPCWPMPAQQPNGPATCQRDSRGYASSMSNTCKNAWSINATFKNTMFFNELGPKQSFCCGVVTPTCANLQKTTVFTRICKPSRLVVSKDSVFTMIFTCQNTTVLSLFCHVLKPSYLSGIALDIGPRDARIINKHTFLQ